MILVDLTYVDRGDMTTGIAVVAYNLLHEWQNTTRQNFVILVRPSTISTIRKEFPKYQTFVCNSLYFINPAFHRLVKSADVLFYPCINAHSLIAPGIKRVGILHDIQKFKLLKKASLKGLAYSHWMKWMLRRYDTIITISEAVSNEIRKLDKHVANKKIVVVPNSIIKYAPVPIEGFDRTDYILNVNTLYPYKNIETLIKAFNEIKNAIPHSLVIKARPTEYWYDTVYPLIVKYGITDRVVLIDKRLTFGQMAHLYSNASLFVSPSTMEGFGLTPVEAAIYNVPVITSSLDVFKETTLGLVNYYKETYNHNELAQKMLEVLYNANSSKCEAIARKLETKYSVTAQAGKILKLLMP